MLLLLASSPLLPKHKVLQVWELVPVGRARRLVGMNDALVPTVASLSAVLLSATVGLVLRYRSNAKPALGAALLEEEATPAAPSPAEAVMSLAEEGEGRRPRAPTRGQRGDHSPLLGSRVEFHGLQKAAALNGSYGVVLRESAGRFAVREVHPPGRQDALEFWGRRHNQAHARRLRRTTVGLYRHRASHRSVHGTKSTTCFCIVE